MHDVNWHPIDSQFLFHWKSSDMRLDLKWHSIDSLLTLHWQSIDIQLTVNWHSIGSQLTFNWQCIDIQLAVNLYSIGSQLAFHLQLNQTPFELPFRRIRLAMHWVVQSLAKVQNLAEIEASHWSRAQNPGFLLVERTL